MQFNTEGQQPVNSERQIFSVSQVNLAAKNLLDTYLPLLWVEGEVSNFSTPSSGHWYFTLKDAKAQVRCAMFKGRNQRLGFKPKSGDNVVLRAKVSLYEGRGDYQLIAEHMEPAGFGDLQRKYEILKSQLQAEGLFEPTHKKSLPKWPTKLGVITSPTGAAIHDILNVLKRRFPSLEIIILPVAVQGASAADQIAKAITMANQYQLCDTLLLARGGGSMEDLWAFNEEVVARAIFHSKIPLISAIGHEVDFTIADFVADLRAPTPSAAAELISSNQEHIQQVLLQYTKSLKQLVQQKLTSSEHKLKHARVRLQHPGQTLRSQVQTVDQLEMRMAKAMNSTLKDKHQQLTSFAKSLSQANPRKQLMQKQQNILSFHKRLIHSVKTQLQRKTQAFHSTTDLLHSVSPLNTLNRGYSILLDSAGKAVHSNKHIVKGERLIAHLSEGLLECEVLESRSK